MTIALTLPLDLADLRIVRLALVLCRFLPRSSHGRTLKIAVSLGTLRALLGNMRGAIWGLTSQAMQ
jgi:hypothetical protein